MKFIDDVLYVDNSCLTATHDCETRGLLRYWHGYTSREERAPLKAGQAGHAALEVYWSSGFDLERALETFDQEYQDWAEANVPESDRLSYTNVYDILHNYMAQHSGPESYPAFTIDPKMVEIGFAEPISDDPPIVFVGKADAIVRDPGQRSYYVLDHKFTSRVDGYWASKYEVNSQTYGYSWAIQRQLGLPLAGMFINAIELKKLPGSERICPTHSTKDEDVTYAECGDQHYKTQLWGPFTFTDELLEEWRKTAVEIAIRYWDLCEENPYLQHLHNVRLHGLFGWETCKMCEFKDFCVTGRKISHVKAMLAYDPWEPFDVESIIKEARK